MMRTWEVLRPLTPAIPGAEDPVFGVWPILHVSDRRDGEVHSGWHYARTVINPERVMLLGWPYLAVLAWDLGLLLDEEMA